MKKRRFPKEVASFFNPHKSFSKRGTHQYEKSKESSYVIAYNGGGTARKVMDENGKITYK